MPLCQSLERLSRRALLVDPEGPILDWGRQNLRLATDEAERAWFARAWWGYHAIRTVRAALVEGRIKEVMDLVEPMDTSHLDRALAGGRGVVLAGAHLGPYPVGRQIFSRLGCGALLLQSHPGLEAPGIKTLTLSREGGSEEIPGGLLPPSAEERGGHDRGGWPLGPSTSSRTHSSMVRVR